MTGTLFRVGETDDLETLWDIDRDAGTLFEQAGLHLDLPDDHEFPVSERKRWLRSLDAGNAIIAMDLGGQAVGFAAVGLLAGTAVSRTAVGAPQPHAARDRQRLAARCV